MSELRTGSKTDRGAVVDPPGRTKQEIVNGAEKPEALPVNPEGIPEALRQLPCWLPWRWYKPKKGANAGKLTKVPIDPRTGRFAKWSDPAVPGAFEDAIAYHLANLTTTAGVGPVRSPVHPYLILDFDNAIDPHTGKLKPWAEEWLNRFDSFTDISPTRTGFKVVVKGQWNGEGSKRPCGDGTIEVYGGKHFFTLTGHKIEGTPGEPQERQEQLDQLAREVFGLHEGNGTPATNGEGLPLRPAAPTDRSDLAVITRISKWQNNMKFSDLMNGRWQGYAATPSEADTSLLCMLGFATGLDWEQALRIFLASKLAERAKAEREDYLTLTLAFCKKVQTVGWQPRRSRKGEEGGKGEGEGAERPGVKVLCRLFGRLEDQGPEALLADKQLLAALADLQQSDPESYQQALGEALAHGLSRERIDRALAGDEPNGPSAAESPIEECTLTPTAEQSPNGEATRPTANVAAEGEGSRGGGGPGPGLVAGQQLGDHQGEQLPPGPGPGMVPAIADREGGKGEGAKDKRYCVRNGCLCRWRKEKDDLQAEPLCNFDARIVEQLLYQDGSDKPKRFVVVEGTLSDGSPLPPAKVAAGDFDAMNWLMDEWGPDALVEPEQGRKPHLAYAIKSRSRPIPQRTVYQHTGWLKTGKDWVYLSAGAVIGANGAVPDLAVELSGALAGYQLPPPPQGQVLRRAIRQSLELRRLGPSKVMYALLAAIFRAPLGGTDYSISLNGATGGGKSELLALAAQHFGRTMNRRKLAANFTSTANYLEGLQYLTKDALLPIDDYAPQPSRRGRDEQAAKAERVGRNQGNLAARGRSDRSGLPQAPRPPRGLLLISGEDLPPGASLLHRHFVLYLPKGAIPLERFGPYQDAARRGDYEQALAGYLQWIAPQYEQLQHRLEREQQQLRSESRQILPGQLHPRAYDVFASLLFGWRVFLEYALASGAISEEERRELWDEGLSALRLAASEQAEHAEESKPEDLFLRTLRSAIASGRAHLAGPNGGAPLNATAWGWREELVGTGPYTDTRPRPQGERIGFIADNQCYLLFEPAFKAVSALLDGNGETFPLRPLTLKRTLNEADQLGGVYTSGGRTRFTLQVELAGQEQDVLHYLPLSNCQVQDPASSQEQALPSE